MLICTVVSLFLLNNLIICNFPTRRRFVTFLYASRRTFVGTPPFRLLSVVTQLSQHCGGNHALDDTEPVARMLRYLLGEAVYNGCGNALALRVSGTI